MSENDKVNPSVANKADHGSEALANEEIECDQGVQNSHQDSVHVTKDIDLAATLSDDCESESFDNDQGEQYSYRDYSHVTKDDDPGLVVDNPPPSTSSRANSESSIRVQKFPVKLYVILAQKEFNDIITWMPHGRSWKILKPALFESMVMPLFFEYSNYHSFNRLVNAWSFRRISSGPDRGSYYHEVSIYQPVIHRPVYSIHVSHHTFFFHVAFSSWATASAKIHEKVTQNSKETPNEQKG